MFTGIISTIGQVVSITGTGDVMLRIACTKDDHETNLQWDCLKIDLGASIACSGICLTVVARGDNWFEVAASAETMSVTTLGSWQQGQRLNLERALSLGDELGGHIVSGHVDGVAKITAITPIGDSHVVWLDAPPELARFIAAKGSVALDGVSLTVNAVDGTGFGVNIIQHSWDVTGWGAAQVGQMMNIEIDMLARYVARLASFDGK